MKKIIFILLFLAANLLDSSFVFGQEVKAFIHYDPETNTGSFMQSEPVIILTIVSNPEAMNDHYQNLAFGKEEKKIKVVPFRPSSVKFKL